jgi:1-aminocyclopropane-1-carboxylate deaminase/D-cysteine desulfhydrase-like pyridoxal-dependent ACC family enzyme
VGFAEEVRAQEREMGLRFDYVIVCTVTGSTHAGMVVGFAADGRERNVIGIDASGTPAQTKAQVGFAEEVRAQEREMGLRFDYVIVCTVTATRKLWKALRIAKPRRSNKLSSLRNIKNCM